MLLPSSNLLHTIKREKLYESPFPTFPRVSLFSFSGCALDKSRRFCPPGRPWNVVLWNYAVMALTFTPSCSNHNTLLAFPETSCTLPCLCIFVHKVPSAWNTSTIALKWLLFVYFFKHNKILRGSVSGPCLTAQVNESLGKHSVLLCFAQFTLSRNTTDEERD